MIDLVFNYKRIFLSVFFTFIILGAVSWITMPREEDPRLKSRFSNIQVTYPGATAEEVHRLVIKSLEDKLVRVDKLQSFESTARSEFAFISLTLKSNVSDLNEINMAWDEVEDAIDKALIDFPEGVLKPVLDRNSLDQDAVVLSITSQKDLMFLMNSSRDLETKLLSTALVASVNRFAYPEEAIRIDVKEDVLSNLGLDILELKEKLELANRSVPSGSIKFESKKIKIKTNASFESIEDLKNYTLDLTNGKNIRLSDIAKIERSIILPNERLFRYNGSEGISLGIVPQKNINLERFGENVKKTIDLFSKENNDINIDIVTFQPGNVSARINELSISLLTGIITIGIALLIAMGFKISILCVFLVPAITLTALSFFSFLDGVLHQISIAAFVVSLGVLVDNVIVVLESIQESIDRGLSKLDAAKNTIITLLLPLTAATGTTIASFIPMLAASGTTADFTRSIPIVVILAVLSSLAISLVITPIFGMWFLKVGGVRNWNRLNSKFKIIGQVSIMHSKKIIIVTTLLILVSLLLFPIVKKQFFNDADRSQLVVEIIVPEGSHYSLVDSIAKRVEDYLLSKDEISSVGAYIGRGTPRFFYNLNLVPRSPHVAQIIVTCINSKAAKKIKDSLQLDLDKGFPEASILIRSLAQGPPTVAPIEYRITDSDPKAIHKASDELINIMRNTEGTTKVRSTVGIGVPVLHFNINDANSSKYNLQRSIIGSKVFARTRGIEIGSYRYGRDVFPIILSNSKNENFSIEELFNINIGQTITGPITLSSVSGAKLSWEPSVISSYNGELTSSVYSEIKDGYSFSSIVKKVEKNIQENDLLKNISIQLGGVAAESEEANTAILKLIPIGALILLISLLIQFNSFKKVFIILGATFPVFIGIIPGLIMLNQPFGFFSLLGLLALIGIVVNNGILIVDQIDRNLKDGKSFEDSVIKGVSRRIRPIFLTNLTTVLGLLPLGFTNSSLWPPFAWTMIFGLISSMVFTPLLVPAMYVFFLKKSLSIKFKKSFTKSSVVSLFFLVSFFSVDVSFAREKVGLYDLIKYVDKHPLLKSQSSELNEKTEEIKRLKSKMYTPSIGLNLQRLKFNSSRELQTPLGNFGATGLNQTNISLILKQSIYNPKLWHGEVESVEFEEKSYQAYKSRLRLIILSNAVQTYSKQIQLKFKIESLTELIEKFKKQRLEISRLLSFGRVSNIDLLKIDLILSENISKLFTLENQYDVSKLELGVALGLNESRTATEIDKTTDVFEAFEFMVYDQKTREDIKALDFKIKSLSSQMKSISFSRLPEISLIGSYNWESPSAYTPNDYSFVGVELSWNIFNSNERSFQKNKINHLMSSIEYTKQNLKNNIKSEKKLHQASLLSLINEWPQKKKDLIKSSELVKIESSRYFKGKSSLNDLLNAEIINQSKVEEVLIHPYAYLYAWALYQESMDFPDWNKLKKNK